MAVRGVTIRSKHRFQVEGFYESGCKKDHSNISLFREFLMLLDHIFYKSREIYANGDRVAVVVSVIKPVMPEL